MTPAGDGRVRLDRALSKLGVSSRSVARLQIAAGRVRVDGVIVRDPAHLVDPDRTRIRVDDDAARRQAWRTLLLHKPRGTVTTRRDPQGRPTVFDVLGAEAGSLVTVGRLDLASSGLLLLTTDTRLADWLTDPANALLRRYVVTVRGALSEDEATRMTAGIGALAARAVTVRKRSRRESHLIVELDEGKNREIRRLCAAVGHEVTALKRIAFGGFELGSLPPGRWRELTQDDVRRAAPGAPVRRQVDRMPGWASGVRRRPSARSEDE